MLKKQSAKVYSSLKKILGEKFVIKDPTSTFAYTHDSSMFGGTEAAFVVRPGSTEEVSRIMVVANELLVPVVIRGGGASIFGQPKGNPGSNILLDMTRMNRVLSIDRINRTVTAEAGIIMNKLQYACNKAGFFKRFPLPAIHIATLGGWLSAAGGGGSLMMDTVGLKVVLPNGKIVQTGGGPGTNTNQPCPFNRYLGGPDLSSLFIGDGGVFGVKTEITTRINRFPAAVHAGGFVFHSLKEVLEMVDGYMERISHQPFDPISVFCPETAKTFVSDKGNQENFVVMAMMEAVSEQELDLKKMFLTDLAIKTGGRRDDGLDKMMESMSLINLDTDEKSKQEDKQNWLSSLNSMGLPAWLSYTLPRKGFSEKFRALLDFRRKLLQEIEVAGYRYNATFDAFTPLDPSTIYGDMALFFNNTSDTKLHALVIKMTRNYQEFGLKIGSLDIHKQGFMTNKFAGYWSSGYRDLYVMLKRAVDPNILLNRDLWEPEQQEECHDRFTS